MKTLIINTYAGSLLLGANAIKGSNVIGSYEDCGFGARITKANRARFPELAPEFEFVDHIKQWPEQDLTDTIVLAHPPCAAFSQQNTSKAKRGVNTDAFECTRKVLKYAFANGAAAVAVESVMGALGGAWDVHDHMAESAGYYVYRILKNSILMGVPQYRERFWCVFVRKDLAQPEFTWRLKPRWTTIAGVLDPLQDQALTPVDGDGLEKNLDRFVAQLTAGPCRCGEKLSPPTDVVHGFDEAELRRVGFSAGDVSLTYKRMGFAKLITPKFFPTEDHKKVCRNHVSPFTSAQPSILAPGGFAPVLLGSSLWVYNGHALHEEEYKAIMGFPVDYVFPEDRGHGMRTYLSKGVCPPVATWVLDNVRRHLGLEQGSPLTDDDGYVKIVRPNMIGSFRPSKTAILAQLESMWSVGGLEHDDALAPLRGDDEEGRDDEDGDDDELDSATA
jgi:site-specific DNA-cytosine methylase